MALVASDSCMNPRGSNMGRGIQIGMAFHGKGFNFIQQDTIGKQERTTVTMFLAKGV
jgi:hypothetical protein